MAKETSLTEGRNITTLLIVVLISTCAALLWAGWYTYGVFDYSKNTTERQIRAEELRGRILHLDEVLTMSARMTAATGNLRWEQRYHQFEPVLDKTIKEAIILVPNAYEGEAATRTDMANIALVEMENRAFALVREGHKEDARELLFGGEYEMQKQIYAKGMAEFSKSISTAIDAELKEQERRFKFYAMFVGMLLPFLLFAWLVVFRAINKWKVFMEANNRILDQKIQERTAEISIVNENLKKEIAERQKAKEALVMSVSSHNLYRSQTRGC